MYDIIDIGVTPRREMIIMRIDAKKVFDLTMRNGGHTVEANGRYMVGLKEYEVKIPIEDFNATMIEVYAKYGMAKDDNATIGTWINEGMVYLDSSKAFKDKNDSIEFAIANDQLAIFDLEELKEIRINQ